jgi:hypothetical protein
MCIVVPDMKLSPNVGSDRSWVWNAAADVSEGEPEAQTLAIRFANSESKHMSMSVAGVYANKMSRRERLQGGFHQGSARERGSVWQGRGCLGLGRIRRREEHARTNSVDILGRHHNTTIESTPYPAHTR